MEGHSDGTICFGRVVGNIVCIDPVSERFCSFRTDLQFFGSSCHVEEDVRHLIHFYIVAIVDEGAPRDACDWQPKADIIYHGIILTVPHRAT